MCACVCQLELSGLTVWFCTLYFQRCANLHVYMGFVMSAQDIVTVILDTLVSLVMKVRYSDCMNVWNSDTCRIYGLYSDLRECEVDNGGCEQVCIDFLGGHNCFCKSGFQPLTNNESSCEGIDDFIY